MPSLIAALSMMQTLLLSSLSVAREREQGTFDQLLVTPYTPLHIMIGKALPPIFIGLIQSTIILLIIMFWFDIPMNGSLGLLYFGLLCFNIAVVGVGLSISAISLNMQQAMLFTFF
jgi:ABC-2 type transport system permease protein